MHQNPRKRTASNAGFTRNEVDSGPSARKRLVSRTRTKITREERAKIRILFTHGTSLSQIASTFRRCETSVTRAIRREGIYYDADDDYDHVDEEFETAYPPPKIKKKERNSLRSHSEDEHAHVLPSITIRKDGVPSSGLNHPPQPRDEGSSKKEVVSASSASHRGSSQSTKIEPKVCVKMYTDSLKKPEPRDIALPGHKDNPIDLGSEPLLKAEERTSISEFLASLDHNLSGLYKSLEKQDLGTPEKLFAIAGWSEQDLHMMFKEALPDITVAQRFILIKGLKKNATL